MRPLLREIVAAQQGGNGLSAGDLSHHKTASDLRRWQRQPLSSKMEEQKTS
jgi:hypothetical protein